MKIFNYLLKSTFLLLPFVLSFNNPTQNNAEALNDYSLLGFDNFNEYVELNNIEIKDRYVAIIDSGIDTDNDYLTDRLELIYGSSFIYSKEYVNGNSKYMFEDDSGRGTMIGGIIKDSTDEHVKIIPIKATNDHNEVSKYHLADALKYLAELKNDYHLNISSAIMPYINDDIEKEIDNIINLDILPIMYSTDTSSKINYDGNGIIINSLTNNYLYDNYHYLSSYSDYGDISFSLPGDSLYTVVPDFYKSDKMINKDGKEYINASGSYLSAGLLSSIVSMYNLYGKSNVEEIKELLKNNSYDLGDYGYDMLYGYGMPSLNLAFNRIDIKPVLSNGLLNEENDFINEFDLFINIENERSGYDYKIYYSLDGSYPYYGISNLYEDNIKIDKSCILKFIVYAIDGNDIISAHTKMYETYYYLNGNKINNDGSGIILDSSGYITKYEGGIKDIEIPSLIGSKVVRGIKNDAFLGLNLNSLKAKFNISLGSYPFNSTNIKKIELDNQNGNEVVKDSKSLEELSLAKLRTILPGDDRASLTFNNSPELKVINLSNVSNIPNKAFKNLKNLSEIHIDNATQIGDEAFYNTTSLCVELELYNVSRVGADVFDGSGVIKIKTSNKTLFSDYDNVLVLLPTIKKENNHYYITGFDITLMIYISDDDRYDGDDKLIYQNRYGGLNDNKLVDYDRFSTSNKYYFFRLIDRSYNTIIESFTDSGNNELLFITPTSASIGSFSLNNNAYYSGEEAIININTKTGYNIKHVKLDNNDITNLIVNNRYTFNIDSSYVLDIEYERILYNITINVEGSGDVVVKRSNVEANQAYYSEYINILATPNNNYALYKVTYGNDTVTNNITISDNLGFYMPAYDIQVDVKFAKKSENMQDYNIVYEENTYILYNYSGNDEYLNIPINIIKDNKTYKLRKINDSCFYNKINIVKIKFDNLDTAVEVGDYAFYGCNNLRELDLKISYIGDSAFYGCLMLNKIYLSDELNYIGSDVFINCIRLQSIYYDSDISNWFNISFINEYSNPLCYGELLYAKNNLDNYYLVSEITIPNNIDKINDYQFYGFNNLNNITFTSNLLSIGTKAFYGCSHVIELNINFNVTTIKEFAFAGMSSLKNFRISNAGLIEEGILVGAASLEVLDLPFIGNMAPTNDSIRYPLGYLFGNSSYSRSTAYEQFSYNPINNKKEYRTYYIPNNLKRVCISSCDIVGYGALYNLNIKEIILADNVNVIESYAFYNNNALEEININNASKISDYAFYNNICLVEVIGNNISEVGYHAFDHNVMLENVDLSNAKLISDYAFYECNKLKNINLENALYIYSYAFYHNDINVINLDNIKYIGLKAFEQNFNLNDLYLSSSINRIDADAFYKTNITSLYYKGDTKNWCNIDFQNEYANPMFYADEFRVFDNNKYKKLDIIRLPNNFKLKSYVFVNLDFIENIFIPVGLKEIDEGAFYSLTGIKNVYYEGGVDDWLKIKFKNRYSNPMCYAKNLYIESNKLINDIVIPSNYSKIGDYQFMNIKTLKSITIPKSVKSIGDYAFYGCDNLNSIIYSGNKDEWNLIEFGENKANPLNITTNITYEEKTPSEEKKEEEQKQEDEKNKNIERIKTEIIIFIIVGASVFVALITAAIILLIKRRR